MSKHPTADEIIEKSIKAHGWDKNEINLAFEFRDFRYELIRKPNFYSYKRTTKKEGIVIQDIMTSKSKLKRYINDTAFKINDSDLCLKLFQSNKIAGLIINICSRRNSEYLATSFGSGFLLLGGL